MAHLHNGLLLERENWDFLFKTYFEYWIPNYGSMSRLALTLMGNTVQVIFPTITSGVRDNSCHRDRTLSAINRIVHVPPRGKINSITCLFSAVADEHAVRSHAVPHAIARFNNFSRRDEQRELPLSQTHRMLRDYRYLLKVDHAISKRVIFPLWEI